MSRITSKLPQLREDLRLHESAAHTDGSPCWTIQDPITNHFYLIGWMEFELLSRWGMGRKDQIIRSTNSETPLDVSEQEFDSLLEFLQKAKLTANKGFEATQALIDESKARAQPLWKQVLHTYLFFRIPIWHPERFLQKLYEAVGWIYSKWTIYALGACAILAFYLTIQQVDVFAASFVDTLTIDGIAGYLVALIFTKSLHEIGHALTSTHFGARVAHMGVAFVVMWPMLYTDTGETWRLKRPKHRLAIASAGVVTELAIAILALLAWNLTPEGAVKNGLFFLATAAWLITLAINVSPFLRFDGYYILSDVLDIPNLHQRAGDTAKTWLRSKLLGWEADYAEHLSSRRRTFFVVFALLSWIYRLVVFLGIAVAVYFLFFKAIGIFLAVVEVWWFVLKPVFKELAVWRDGWSKTRAGRKVLLFLLLSSLAAVILVPWKGSVNSTAVLKPEQVTTLYAPRAGRIQTMVATDEDVAGEQILFLLEDPALAWDIELAKSDKSAIEEQLKSLLGIQGGEARRASLLNSWNQADAKERAVKDLMESLVVRAPWDGKLVDVDPNLAPGIWVNPEQPLARVISPNSWIVEAFVHQSEIALIAAGAGAKFYPASEPSISLNGRVLDISSQRTVTLPNRALSARFGGEIVVEADEEGLSPQETLYKLKIALDLSPEQHHLGVGNLIVTSQAQSLANQFFNTVASVLIRELSF